jgi:hypothetical protein
MDEMKSRGRQLTQWRAKQSNQGCVEVRLELCWSDLGSTDECYNPRTRQRKVEECCNACPMAGFLSSGSPTEQATGLCLIGVALFPSGWVGALPSLVVYSYKST